MHERVVEANRAWYASHVGEYADYRSSGEFLSRYTAEVGRDLDRLTPGAALDCCAGHGLLSRILLDRGYTVTAVDVSPEMLDRIEGVEKIEADVIAFLRDTDRRFDLIVFGSALHHLWDYAEAVALAVERLNPGGAVYVVAEPIRQRSAAGRAVREFEFVWRKLHRHPGDVLPAVKRRLRFQRGAASPTAEPTGDLVGLYAEIHAHGIDLDRVLAVVPAPEVLRFNTTGAPWLRGLKRIVPGYAGDNFTLLARH